MAIIQAQAYESSIINALAVSDPQLNTGLGTPVRKIITAVAREMAAYNVDLNVTTTLYSIDSVSGTELDYLVGQFGFTRQQARAARGSVTFYRDNGDALFRIPYGTQVYKPATSVSQSVLFQTTAYQEMGEGVLTAEVAVVAVVAGAMGNVAANTVTASEYAGLYTNVINKAAMSGGRDAETDEDLRQRFLLTVFRNVSGTQDQMLGLALAHEKVTRANLIGQESRYSEIVQVSESNGQFVAHVSDDRWALDVDSPLDTARRYWVEKTDYNELLSFGDYAVSNDGKDITFHDRNGSDVIGPISIGAMRYLSHAPITSISVVNMADGSAISSSDYVLDAENGTITPGAGVVTGGAWAVDYTYSYLEDGQYVTVSFDYLSKHNRNGLKTVDLFIDSLSPKTVTDVQYIDFDKAITSSNQEDWVRADGTYPQIGHIFVPLSYQPIISSTGQANIGTSMILYEGTHFHVVYDNTKTVGGSRGFDALELVGSFGTSSGTQIFTITGGQIIYDDTPMSIPYNYDAAIEDVQKLIDQQRVVTMDVMVHEAKHRYFVIYLTMMYSVFPRDSVAESVLDNVIRWSDRLGFGQAIQFSDIETVVANTQGVDNVRVARESDAGGRESDYQYSDGTAPIAYGIVELARDGATVVNQFDDDFCLGQNEVAEIQDVVIYSRSQQNWGA